MNGYILLFKKLMGSSIWSKPPLYLKVWIYLLFKAQYQPYNGLKRGQVLTSIPEIQDTCTYYIGYRKTAPTKDQIYRVIDWLRSPHESKCGDKTEEPMITTARTTRGIVVTICNYDDYQSLVVYGSNAENKDRKVTKAKQSQKEAHTIKNKEIKKQINNKKKYIYGEFKNVALSEREHEKLIEKFPSDYQDRIDKLSEYIASKGKKYKNHYATILSWARKEMQNKRTIDFMDLL